MKCGFRYGFEYETLMDDLIHQSDRVLMGEWYRIPGQTHLEIAVRQSDTDSEDSMGFTADLPNHSFQMRLPSTGFLLETAKCDCPVQEPISFVQSRRFMLFNRSRYKKAYLQSNHTMPKSTVANRRWIIACIDAL